MSASLATRINFGISARMSTAKMGEPPTSPRRQLLFVADEEMISRLVQPQLHMTAGQRRRRRSLRGKAEGEAYRALTSRAILQRA